MHCLHLEHVFRPHALFKYIMTQPPGNIGCIVWKSNPGHRMAGEHSTSEPMMGYIG